MTENQTALAESQKLNQVLRAMGSVIAVVLAVALFLWVAERFVRLLVGFVRLWIFIVRLVANPLSFIIRLLIRGVRILLPLLRREQAALACLFTATG